MNIKKSFSYIRIFNWYFKLLSFQKETCRSLEVQVKHIRTQLVDLAGKLRESKMQTDALNDKLQNKDKLFRENLTNSDQNVKIFFGLPGVFF